MYRLYLKNILSVIWEMLSIASELLCGDAEHWKTAREISEANHSGIRGQA